MFVYKITNLVNNKFYIGKTKFNIEKRFNQHKLSNFKNMPIQLAISKYGKDNFIIEQLDTATNDIELNEKEIYYIEKLKPQYNLTKGGDGSFGYKMTVENKELISKKTKEAMNNDVVRKNCEKYVWSKRRGISPWNKGKTNIFSKQTLNDMSKRSEKTYKFINPEGELVEIRNLSRFCKEHNLSVGSMSDVFHGRKNKHSCKGYRKIEE